MLNKSLILDVRILKPFHAECSLGRNQPTNQDMNLIIYATIDATPTKGSA